MAQVRLVSVVLAVIALLVLSGCAQLLPPGWNNTAPQSPTTAVSADIEETDQDIDILDETDATDTVLDEEVVESTPVPNPADSALPRKNAVEGDLVSFPNLQAVDPDGDPITYTFTPPLDAAGKWQTKVGDAGEYRVTITASDGKNSVSQVVIVQVDPKNKPPMIALASKDIVVKEGDTVSLSPQVSDADGDEVTLTISGWMTASSKQTSFEDAGTHDVMLSATDGTATTKESVRVTVQNVNRAPVVDPMGDVAVKEGDKITIAPTSRDPDGDKVSYTFSAPMTADGTWQTGADDVGRYTVEVTASDGDLTSTASFQITVESLNKAPVIQIADLVTVDEGNTVTLAPTITDAEGDELTISYSGWMNANTYKTNYEDAGTHIVTITASDGINTAKKDVTVTVTDQNRPPVFGQGSFS
jgi:hypothetical protein